MLDKYASIWKADTPVERQADARDLWDGLTGISHSKEDTTTRLKSMFPMSSSHTKEAMTTKLRDRLLGSALATGAIGTGLYQRNRSTKNKQGLTPREVDRRRREAAYKTELSLGGSPRSSMSQKIESTRNKLDKYLDEHKGVATGLGAAAGGTAAFLGAKAALTRKAAMKGLNRSRKARP